jgi:hypothetical protein
MERKFGVIAATLTGQDRERATRENAVARLGPLRPLMGI